MKDKIKEISINTVDSVVKSIQEQVRIDSVRDTDNKSDGAPFGPGIKKSLDLFVTRAQEFGMRTFMDPDGFYAYAEVGDENLKEMIGIVGHVDVVPVGDISQWTEAKPFSGDIVDNKIIGRGSLDDKGPVIINLHAVKNLLDLNVELTKRIRIVVGGAEETTWECIDKYNKEQEAPTIAYSPDANFPLINAEKFIAQMDIEGTVDVDFTVEAMGAYNAVCDRVKYTAHDLNPLINELTKLNYEHEVQEDCIIVKGKSAHAMAAHLGDNAICKLAEAMKNIGQTCEVIEFLTQKVKNTTSAELIQGKVSDEISGDLKFNIGRISIKDGVQYLGVDTRVPVLCDENKILNVYEECIKEFGLNFKIHKKQEKLYVEEDSFLIQSLLGAYKDVTQELDAKPLSSGGGTYARAIDNCVAFGCVFEHENMIDKMHQPNECFEIKFLSKALEIYTTALNNLLK